MYESLLWADAMVSYIKKQLYIYIYIYILVAALRIFMRVVIKKLKKPFDNVVLVMLFVFYGNTCGWKSV